MRINLLTPYKRCEYCKYFKGGLKSWYRDSKILNTWDGFCLFPVIRILTKKSEWCDHYELTIGREKEKESDLFQENTNENDAEESY
jgi:hypothetical protein